MLSAARAIAAGVAVRSREVAAAADATGGLLSGASVEFVGVTKKYDTVVAIQDMTLAVERGEFLTLLGPSGSGKSTVLMLLAGFVDASAGEIRVDGRNVSSDYHRIIYYSVGHTGTIQYENGPIRRIQALANQISFAPRGVEARSNIPVPVQHIQILQNTQVIGADTGTV